MSLFMQMILFFSLAQMVISVVWPYLCSAFVFLQGVILIETITLFCPPEAIGDMLGENAYTVCGTSFHPFFPPANIFLVVVIHHNFFLARFPFYLFLQCFLYTFYTSPSCFSLLTLWWVVPRPATCRWLGALYILVVRAEFHINGNHL